jgi:hypothetical protein
VDALAIDAGDGGGKSACTIALQVGFAAAPDDGPDQNVFADCVTFRATPLDDASNIFVPPI